MSKLDSQVSVLTRLNILARVWYQGIFGLCALQAPVLFLQARLLSFCLVLALYVLLILLLDPWLQDVKLPQTDFHFSLRFCKDSLGTLVVYVWMDGQMCKDKVGVSEKQEVSLLVISFSFIDLCLPVEDLVSDLERSLQITHLF